MSDFRQCCRWGRVIVDICTKTSTAATARSSPRTPGSTVVRDRGLDHQIYCRPSCPARSPFARNVRFYPTAAAAQRAGFRPCKRCRPDASPGSPEWNVRGDVVARAMRLIADGTVDRDGVSGLAAKVGYTPRQLERLLQAEVGAGPLALARAQRTQTARVLIETTQLPFSARIRGGLLQHQTVQRHRPRGVRHHTYRPPQEGHPPSGCQRRHRGHRNGVAAVADADAVRIRGALRASGRRRSWLRGGAKRRLPSTLELPWGSGIVSLTPAPDHVRCVLWLNDFRDLSTAIARCRRLLDLDSDPEAVVDFLGADRDLTALVAKHPGQRIPRTVDEHELAIRAVIGQQVSMKAAQTHTARLAERYGTPIFDPEGGLTHIFPSVDRLAGLDRATLALPKSRRRSIVELVGALAEGTVLLGPGCDWQRARRQLLELPGGAVDHRGDRDARVGRSRRISSWRRRSPCRGQTSRPTG